MLNLKGCRANIRVVASRQNLKFKMHRLHNQTVLLRRVNEPLFVLKRGQKEFFEALQLLF